GRSRPRAGWSRAWSATRGRRTTGCSGHPTRSDHYGPEVWRGLRRLHSRRDAVPLLLTRSAPEQGGARRPCRPAHFATSLKTFAPALRVHVVMLLPSDEKAAASTASSCMTCSLS